MLTLRTTFQKKMQKLNSMLNNTKSKSVMAKKLILFIQKIYAKKKERADAD